MLFRFIVSCLHLISIHALIYSCSNHTYRHHSETNTPPPLFSLVHELSDTQSLLQSPPPDTSSSPGASCSARHPSLSVVSSSPNSKRSKSKYQCQHCGFESKNKDPSNLKRHEKACRRNPANKARNGVIKEHKCHCGKSYGRSDNLRAHKNLKHKKKELELLIMNMSPDASTSKLSRASLVDMLSGEGVMCVFEIQGA
jgi:uncharacterized Zn-finger protein